MRRKLQPLKVGDVLNRLTIISIEPKIKSRSYVIAKCECGNVKKYEVTNIRRTTTKGCGCFLRKESSIRMKEYNEKMANDPCSGIKNWNGLSTHRLYNIWKGMIDRCENPNNNAYKNYGGKGVVVCELWKNDYTSFFNWSINNGYAHGLEIDKDIKGTGFLYSPDTCCWVTKSENCMARKGARLIDYNGEKINLVKLASMLNMTRSTLTNRLNRNWDIERAFNQKQRTVKRRKC